ncbi:hypothetical protein [Nannocystis punicea]|uniref:Tetratricopeptide repeat protein n=1 Tax=Nannocystis punicea TaxID=2995304 RepID=A0ABY7H1G7_9BACT|nr:hypothetical protein [Nannocystis poenicansa]WAS93096.1 hypothetical protein O0S08_43595 [Nannocystis poenicansa]
MSEAPALVSATLAQLYMQQEHLEQARRVLARVLAADPLHGHALVLAERLAHRSRARLYAAFQPGRGVVVRWHDAPPDPALHLILAVFRPVPALPGRTSTWITSARCREQAGEHTFEIAGGPRPNPASASLCLARLGADGLQLLAVHEAISWPTPAGP